jgi:hypothetical protein
MWSKTEKILFAWFVGFPVLVLIYSYIRDIGHSGGEQVFFSNLAGGFIVYFLVSALAVAGIIIKNVIQRWKK